MIEKDLSLQKADKVVECLRPLIPPTEKVILECFANGREQGYFIYPDKPGRYDPKSLPAVAFAEQKNGDAIAIYTGMKLDFATSANQPSNERTWKSLIEAPTPQDAARIIADHILGRTKSKDIYHLGKQAARRCWESLFPVEMLGRIGSGRQIRGLSAPSLAAIADTLWWMRDATGEIEDWDRTVDATALIATSKRRLESPGMREAARQRLTTAIEELSARLATQPDAAPKIDIFPLLDAADESDTRTPQGSPRIGDVHFDEVADAFEELGESALSSVVADFIHQKRAGQGGSKKERWKANAANVKRSGESAERPSK